MDDLSAHVDTQELIDDVKAALSNLEASSSPEESARLALEKTEQGYPRLQIKCGGRSVDEDIASMAELSHEKPLIEAFCELDKMFIAPGSRKI